MLPGGIDGKRTADNGNRNDLECFELAAGRSVASVVDYVILATVTSVIGQTNETGTLTCLQLEENRTSMRQNIDQRSETAISYCFCSDCRCFHVGIESPELRCYYCLSGKSLSARTEGTVAMLAERQR
jgi:hypothetical protein